MKRKVWLYIGIGVIKYEQEHYPIEVPTLTETMNARLSENNWSQKEMAALLGMSASRLNAILSGKVNPTFEQAKRISSRLNISPAIVLAYPNTVRLSEYPFLIRVLFCGFR